MNGLLFLGPFTKYVTLVWRSFGHARLTNTNIPSQKYMTLNYIPPPTTDLIVDSHTHTIKMIHSSYLIRWYQGPVFLSTRRICLREAKQVEKCCDRHSLWLWSIWALIRDFLHLRTCLQLFFNFVINWFSPCVGWHHQWHPLTPCDTLPKTPSHSQRYPFCERPLIEIISKNVIDKA